MPPLRSLAAGLTAVWFAALCGLVAAQSSSSVGSTYASVALTGIATLGPQVSLSLPDTVTFDLMPGADPEVVPACVVGLTDADPPTSQTGLAGLPVAPAGTTFTVGAFPSVHVSSGPSIAAHEAPFDARPVVCFRTFVMSIFSNMPGWQLTVDRQEVSTVPAIEHLFVGAACPEHETVDMYRLDAHDNAALITATAAGGCQSAVAVLALRPGHETTGTAEAHLRYTLMASGGEFGAR